MGYCGVGHATEFEQSYVVDKVISKSGFPFFGNILMGTEDVPEAVQFTSFTADLSNHDQLLFRFEAPENERFQWIPSDNPDSGFLLDTEFAFGSHNDATLLTAEEVTVSFIDLVGDAPFVPDVTALFSDDGQYFELNQDLTSFDTGSSAEFRAIEVLINYSNLTDRDGWQSHLFEPVDGSILQMATFDLDGGSDPSLTIIPESKHYALLFLGSVLVLVLAARQATEKHSPRFKELRINSRKPIA